MVTTISTRSVSHTTSGVSTNTSGGAPATSGGAATSGEVSATRAAPRQRGAARIDDEAGHIALTRLGELPPHHPNRGHVRDKAIRCYLPMARQLAHRFADRGEPLDDLVQVATIGLIKAIDGYDVDRGVSFAGYAVPTITGELKRHFRDHAWSLRVPRRLQELKLAIGAAIGPLGQRLGRSPTVADLAAYLGISEDEVIEGLDTSNAYSTLSLSTPVGSDDGDAELGDVLGADDPELVAAEHRIALRPALEALPPRERHIVVLRFFGNLTQSQIAEHVGVSQMHVSRLLRRSLTQLRDLVSART